jgi:hypothetical protein
MSQATFRASPLEQNLGGSAPLITLFERDDAIAVPLLSQLRMAGYDVRAARTPVELFDILSKSLVALVLVDLGAATAGRREFWVALDAQRRGRATQVMTFRFVAPHGDLDLDMEPSARAIPDVEAHGAHEFQRIIDGVRQRVPLHNIPSAHVAPGAAMVPGMGPGMAPGSMYAPNGGIQPLGAALGMAPTPFSAQNGHLFNMPGYSTPAPAGWGGIAPLGVSPVSSVFEGASAGMFPPSQPLASLGGYGAMGQVAPSPMPPHLSAQMGTTPFDPANPPAAPFAGAGPSPFANPTPSNPFGPGSSPFAQPYQANPFGAQVASAPIAPIAPPQPAPQPQPWQAMSQAGAFPPSMPSNMPSSYPSSYPPSLPPSFPPSAPSSVPPWSVGAPGSFPSPISGIRPDSGPMAFGGSDSLPGYSPYGPASQPSYAQPAFQDAWSPPDAESDLPTGVVPEIAFQQSTVGISAGRMPGGAPPSRKRAWDEMGGPLLPPTPDSYIAPRSQLSAEPEAYDGQGAHHAHHDHALVSTPTEVALGGVLVNGALLTPGRLEALQEIQAIMAEQDMKHKLGELAVTFKFLSADQMLAALLVTRGLVTPQRIAELGQIKKRLAERGQDADLETLLIQHHVLPAEKVRQIRAEISK